MPADTEGDGREAVFCFHSLTCLCVAAGITVPDLKLQDESIRRNKKNKRAIDGEMTKRGALTIYRAKTMKAIERKKRVIKEVD